MTKTLRNSKVLIALLIIAAMAFSVAPVFADAPGDYPATLYKDGKFDSGHPNDNKSMGDGAFSGADVSYDDWEDVTTLTVYVTSMNFIGMTGYVTEMDLNGVNGEPLYNGGTYPYAFEFTFNGELSGDVQFSANPTIYIVGLTHMNVNADLVVFGI